MSNERKRQKKREEKKKKRDAVKSKMRQGQLGRATSLPGIIRQSVSSPFGPTYVSFGWNDLETSPPSLVTVVVTRKLPDGRLLPGVALVDRTCLGVKNGFAMRPMTPSEFAATLEALGESYEGDMEPCELLLGQSIVFHAMDYAHSLGFSPHPDFPALLFGTRPNELLDTPYARPARPIYVSGPDDKPAQIVAQLERAVGRGNFDLASGAPNLGLSDASTRLIEEGTEEPDDAEDEADDVAV